MSLQTFVLSDQTASLPVGSLLDGVNSGGIEVRDAAGKIVAFVLPPHDSEAWAYAEASVDFLDHREEIQAAMQRRMGATTSELLENVRRKGEIHDLKEALDVIGGVVADRLKELEECPKFEGGHKTDNVPKAKAG